MIGEFTRVCSRQLGFSGDKHDEHDKLDKLNKDRAPESLMGLSAISHLTLRLSIKEKPPFPKARDIEWYGVCAKPRQP